MNWIVQLKDVGTSVAARSGKRHLFNNVNLELKSGARLALLGPSGCGKSTLLSVIAGLIKPESGEVRRLQASVCGFVFQSDTYLPWRSVAGNLEFSAHGRVGPGELDAEMDRLLLGLRLSPKVVLDRRLDTLSGGERRRVCLAMALIAKPDLLLLDEANSGLDEGTRFAVCDFLIEEITKSRACLVMVTHDIEEALLLSDQLLLMKNSVISEVSNGLPPQRCASDRFSEVAQRQRAELAAALYG
jgi:ABC-type nitrate/sulfonate/bicarbonate transport system ATPase subunit